MLWLLEIIFDCLKGLLVLIPLWCIILKLTGRKILNLHNGLVFLYASLLLAVFSVTGLPDIQYIRLNFTWNIVPFVDLFHSPIQYFLNMILFLPFGFLLPLLWEQYSNIKNILGFGFFLTFFIETAQVFTFRTTDIDDLISNVLGILLGFFIIKKLHKKIKLPSPPENERVQTPGWEAYWIAAFAFLIWFFILPFLPVFS